MWTFVGRSFEVQGTACSKALEAGVCLMCSRKGKEDGVARAEKVRGRSGRR